MTVRLHERKFIPEVPLFIGHFAVGFAAKRAAPRTSLTLLVVSALWLDILWPVFLWLGWETVRVQPGITTMSPLDFVSYPWSHSLAMTLVWAALLGLGYRWWRRYPAGAWWVAICVFSHWVLDFLVHRPDLPLYPGGPERVGLGLWNDPLPEVILEVGLFGIGVALYRATTRPRGWAGSLSLASLTLALCLLYLLDLKGSAPPSVGAVEVVGLVSPWIFALWLVWIDRTRNTMLAS